MAGRERQDPAQACEALLLATVGARRIALPAGAVAAVLPLLPLWRPPTLPAPLAGFARVRGTALPVLDARRLLGEAEAPATLEWHILMLAGVADAPAGLLVDRAEALLPAALRAVLPLDAAATLGGCAAALIDADGPVHLLAVERLLAAGERRALDALARDAAARLAGWATAAA